nr:MAG: hypothetical protein 1 [Enamovirus sp.]
MTCCITAATLLYDYLSLLLSSEFLRNTVTELSDEAYRRSLALAYPGRGHDCPSTAHLLCLAIALLWGHPRSPFRRPGCSLEPSVLYRGFMLVSPAAVASLYRRLAAQAGLIYPQSYQRGGGRLATPTWTYEAFTISADRAMAGIGEEEYDFALLPPNTHGVFTPITALRGPVRRIRRPSSMFILEFVLNDYGRATAYYRVYRQLLLSNSRFTRTSLCFLARLADLRYLVHSPGIPDSHVDLVCVRFDLFFRLGEPVFPSYHPASFLAGFGDSADHQDLLLEHPLMRSSLNQLEDEYFEELFELGSAGSDASLSDNEVDSDDDSSLSDGRYSPPESDGADTD